MAGSESLEPDALRSPFQVNMMTLAEHIIEATPERIKQENFVPMEAPALERTEAATISSTMSWLASYLADVDHLPHAAQLRSDAAGEVPGSEGLGGEPGLRMLGGQTSLSEGGSCQPSADECVKAAVRLHRGTLCSCGRGGPLTLGDSLEGPGEPHAKLSEPVRETRVYTVSRMWNLMNKVNEQNRSRDIDAWDRLTDPRGEG